MSNNFNRTSEETKREYVEKMGAELGTIFNLLWSEVVSVNWTWNEFLELYVKKPSRIELLNKSAAFFFKTIQSVLWDNTLLHISRLTDPEKSAGKANLSIQQLPGLVSPELRPELQNLVSLAIKKSAFSRDWRNRYIAHRDLNLTISDEPVKPLQIASSENVNEALRAIEAVLNAISHSYMASTTAFSNSIVHSGAEHLLYVLDDGLKMDFERREQIKAHTWDFKKDLRKDL